MFDFLINNNSDKSNNIDLNHFHAEQFHVRWRWQKGILKKRNKVMQLEKIIKQWHIEYNKSKFAIRTRADYFSGTTLYKCGLLPRLQCQFLAVFTSERHCRYLSSFGSGIVSLDTIKNFNENLRCILDSILRNFFFR